MTELVADIREDFGHTIISVRYELRKHLRRKRIAIALLLALVIPLLFYLIPVIRDSPFPDTSASFMSSMLGFMEMLIIISAAMFAGDAVCGEFESKTALMTLSSPQRRSSIFIGKYMAALIIVLGIVTLYYFMGILEIFGAYGIGHIPGDTLTSYLFSLLFTCAVVSLTFFFSAIIKGVMAATLLSFFSLMMILPIISALLTVADVDPWFIVTSFSSLITDVFIQPPAFGGGGGDGEGGGPAGAFSSPTPNFTTGIEVVAVYAVVFFMIGLYLATRKDVE